jgi:F0F1-type ATP synthase delta subunit
VAKVYAQAIIEAAADAKCLDAVLSELATLARDVLPRVPEAQTVFASPKVAAEDKAAMIDKIAKGRLTPTTVNALHVLAKHGRLGILAAVAAEARPHSPRPFRSMPRSRAGWSPTWRSLSRRG